MTTQPHTGARRAADPVADENILEADASGLSARRAQRGRVGRRTAVAAVGTALGGIGVARFVSGRSTETPLVSTEAAVPEAAVEAAEEHFADRSRTASRNLVRNEVSEAVADVTSEDRDRLLEEYNTGAYQQLSGQAAAERDKKMEADLKLVDQQAAQLKREAEEAERRLEEARKAAERRKNRRNKAPTRTGGGDDAQQTPDSSSEATDNEGAGNVSAEDVAAASSTGGSMPLKSGYRIGARFGQRGSWSRYHTGQDFPAPTGTPIYAVASGIVLSPTSGGWAGINVVLQHGGRGSTLYAHMSRKVVSAGQAVKAGQLIGYVGNTGRSFGAHLHMEYYRPGVTPGSVYQAADPMAFLRQLGVR